MTEPYLPYQPHALDNMNTTLEAGNQTVLRQAPITTNEYLMSAQSIISIKRIPS